jgi:hypothetical protein
MTSVSDNIAKWKQKAEIDYFSLFIPLWLAFNAWIKDRHIKDSDRESIESLKEDNMYNKTYLEFSRLLQGSDSKCETFKDYLSQLIESLDSASITYHKYPSIKISFRSALIDNQTTPKTYENLLRESGQHNKIELIKDKYIDADTHKVYKSYIEILYQMRCILLHGNLNPTPENERVIKYLYLTLKEISQDI